MKKRRKPANLRLKTKALWQRAGWHVGLVESHFGRFSFDLYGFADLIAFRPTDSRVVLIQVGPWDHRAQKIKDIAENRIAQDWLRHHRIFLGLWKVDRRGARRKFEYRGEEVGAGATVAALPDMQWQGRARLVGIQKALP